MLSQLFVLSPRGDTIVSRDYRHDVSRSSHDAFFRALKFGTGSSGEEGDVAPVFLLDGVNYFHVKARLASSCAKNASARVAAVVSAHRPRRAQAAGLLFVATSRDNLPPALVLELLQRVSRVIKARTH